MAGGALSSEIKKFALNILENGQVVTCMDQLRIDKLRSGSNVTKENNCDRFRLLIPYGGATLKWEIVFNSNEPHFPPDVLFGDSEPDFEPNLEEIPSLQYWNPEDPNNLTAIINELLEQYKQFQYDLIKACSPKVAFEFESIRHLDTLTSMEVYVHRNTQNSFQQANFLIKLPIDLAKLPPYLINHNPGKDFIMLYVSYEGYNGSTVTPKVLLSPRVMNAFSDVSNVKYPSWTDGDECLVSYILAVHGYFNEKIDEVIESYERRRNYVAAFLSAYGTCVLEYDAEAFSMISFLIQHENFFCILTIEIVGNFPEEQPVFIMKSIYHCFGDEPYQAIDDSYPYSPRWSPDEMVNRARSYLATAIPNFKIASVKNKPYQAPGL